MNRRKKQLGFTLVELMIVIAIVGILAAVAMPMYKTYTMKARFAEAMNVGGAVKSAIIQCAASARGTTVVAIKAECDTYAEMGIQDPATNAPLVATAAVSGDLVVTVTGTTEVDDRTYILTPTIDANFGSISWAYSGTCDSGTPQICQFN